MTKPERMKKGSTGRWPVAAGGSPDALREDWLPLCGSPFLDVSGEPPETTGEPPVLPGRTAREAFVFVETTTRPAFVETTPTPKFFASGKLSRAGGMASKPARQATYRCNPLKT